MKKNKMAIVPIIATILLLGASVAIFISFSSWFNLNNSAFFSKFQDNSSDATYLKANDLNLNVLYLDSSENTNLTLIKIINKTGDLKCELNGLNLNKGINSIDVSSCSLIQGKAYNIFGIVSNGINFENNFIMK